VRVVLDTNVLVSALLSPGHPPALLLNAWLDNRFELLVSRQQLAEIGRVTRYPGLKSRIRPSEAGRLINLLGDLATNVMSPVEVDMSPDPFDNFLLGLAISGAADYLVTGDKAGVLALKRVGQARIVSAHDFCRTLKLL
jgi:putative PIN family toxin of toxin-antitoxin system